MEATMETKRLLLRPWQTDDAEALYELARDPSVGPAAGWVPHTSAEDSRHIIESILAPPDTWALVWKQIGRPIGSVGVFPSRAEGAPEGDLELGFWIGKAYWGQSFAPEAVECLLTQCFAQPDCERVWCGYFDGNDKSRRVQEKCGFLYHHTERDKIWPITGEIKTEHFTCMNRKQFCEKYIS